MRESELTTKNIKESINQIAKRFDLCDYELVQYSTFLYDSNNGEINSISDKSLNEDIFLHPDLRVLQEYTIIFREYDSEDEMPDKLLDVKLNASKDLCEVYADIKLSDDVPYTKDEINSQIISEINKKKALHGVLLGIFEDNMFETLDFKVEELMRTMSVRMVVAKSKFRAIDTQRFEIQRVFLENKKDINSQFIHTTQGRVLLRVTPYRKGVGGRSCFGRYLYFQDYEQGVLPEITYDSDNVELVSDASGRLAYVARRNGVVEFDNYRIDVKDSVMLSKISQAKTGDIELDDVGVYVKAIDELDDSVENGTSVESEKLDVDTMVGANSKVKSSEVTVRASTHSTSSIEAYIANIKIHKGTLKAHKADIGTLEHGFVEANEVYIENVLGGKVVAENVKIKNIQASFADILARKKITVENIMGEGNILRIKYGFSQEEIDSMAGLKKKLEFLGNDATKLTSAIDKNKKFFILHKMKIDEILRKPKSNLSIAEQKMAQAAVAIRNQIIELEVQKATLLNQKDSIQKKLNQFANDIFFSEIRVGTCKAGNVIEFTRFREKRDEVVRYITTENDNNSIFTLSEGMYVKKERF